MSQSRALGSPTVSPAPPRRPTERRHHGGRVPPGRSDRALRGSLFGVLVMSPRRRPTPAAATPRAQAQATEKTGPKTRRRRRSGFGYIISKGTTSHPAFVIRWYEGTNRKQKSGFTTRTAAAEGLARVRTGLGDGTLVTKRRAVVGFDKVAKEWLELHSKPNLRSHDDNQERYVKHLEPFFGPRRSIPSRPPASWSSAGRFSRSSSPASTARRTGRYAPKRRRWRAAR